MGDNEAQAALDAVIAVALAGNAAAHDALRDELLSALADAWTRGATAAEALDACRDVLTRHAGPLAGLLADSELAAWLYGGGRVAEQLPAVSPTAGGPPPPGPPPHLLPFGGREPDQPQDPWEWPGASAWLPLVEGAADALRRRRLVSRDDFDRLDAEARRRAFTVADVASLETLDRLRGAVTQAVEEGTGLEDFRAAADEALGRGALGPGHLENVLRTNLSQAYSDGYDHVADRPLVRAAYPYDECIVVRDSRLTPLCAAVSRAGIQGTNLFRRDDPTWREYREPRHWQCRCTRRLVGVEEAARRGILEAIEWLRTGTEPAAPAWVPRPAAELPRGWRAA